ncbi:hypothetical protein GZ59_44030 [Pectobacterium atrosepticum]|nr:hypothetical protein GZ59_44030 [Pectobacterium atrosepticum]
MIPNKINIRSLVTPDKDTDDFHVLHKPAPPEEKDDEE